MKTKLVMAVMAVLFSSSLYSQTICESGLAGIYPCNNVDLLATFDNSPFGAGVEANDIWGWTDALDGKEYVILGLTNGTAFFDISDPVNPIYLGFLPTQTTNSLWRDMKVYADHAFIVSEAGGHGMQVFDLTRLRNVIAPPETFTVDAHYSNFGNAHNIVINETTGRAYAVGSNTASGGLHIIDISNPLSPSFIGQFSEDGYTHDAQVVTYNGPDASYIGREIAFACNENTVTIVDVTDATDTQELSSVGYANSAYTHQGWLTPDHQYFLSNDELDESNFGNNTRTIIWDVSDLDAPVVIGDFFSTEAAIDHNLYTDGNLTFQSNYRAGLRILDHQNVAAANLSEVAYFDCYPSSNSANFNGTWSNYPYFASGVVAVSHIEEGLFLLRPQFLHATTPDDLYCFTDDVVADITVEDGFVGPVGLSVVSGLPAGATATFSDNNVGPGAYTLTISGLPASADTYDIVVEGAGFHFTYTSTLSFSTYDCINDVLGCTDPGALNYNSAATIDDGSCIYPCEDVTFSFTTDCWGGEVSWDLVNDATGATVASVSGGTYGNQQTFTWNGCLEWGCYTMTIQDSFGDGQDGTSSGCSTDGDYEMTLDADGSIIFEMAVPNYGSEVTHNFCVPLTLDGCTDSAACNYNPAATNDDGSCQYLDACGVCGGTGTIAGCTDLSACNYNAAADCDDGSCQFLDACGVCGGSGTIAGCTDLSACNYNAAADCEDGSCQFLDACGVCGGAGTVAGCTDSTACNYNAAADCDDGSCQTLDACGVCGGAGTVAGCTDSSACNFNAAADCDDGSCQYLDACGVCGGSGTIAGCTDMSACNYNASADCDDGSCQYLDACGVCGGSGTIAGCMDSTACNYDSTADCNDGSCEYDSCACVADYNDDGIRNTQDLLFLLADYGCAGGCTADLNGDDVTNSEDILVFLTVFGLFCD